MVAEAERTGRQTSLIAERVQPWRIRSLASAVLAPGVVAGALGALYFAGVTSGWTAEAMAITMIGFAGLSGIATFAARRADV